MWMTSMVAALSLFSTLELPPSWRVETSIPSMRVDDFQVQSFFIYEPREDMMAWMAAQECPGFSDDSRRVWFCIDGDVLVMVDYDTRPNYFSEMKLYLERYPGAEQRIDWPGLSMDFTVLDQPIHVVKETIRSEAIQPGNTLVMASEQRGGFVTKWLDKHYEYTTVATSTELGVELLRYKLLQSDTL